MKLPSRLNAAFTRFTVWRKANARKLLKEMPTAYLASVAAPSAVVVLTMQPHLAEATQVFAQKLVPLAPWYISTTLGVWLFAVWALVGLSALLAATHGKALGERLFDSPPKE